MVAKLEFRHLFASLTADEKRDLALAANTSVAYLSQIAYGHRKAGAELIAHLSRADSRITPEMLRPDLYLAA